MSSGSKASRALVAVAASVAVVAGLATGPAQAEPVPAATTATPTPTPTPTIGKPSKPSKPAKPAPVKPAPAKPAPTKPAPVKPAPAASAAGKKKPAKTPKKKPKVVVPEAQSWAEQGVTKLGVAGVDVSHWQHSNGSYIDWGTVRKQGVRWMYTKCSDGLGTPGEYDRWAPIDVQAAALSGIATGCYHYAQPAADAAGVVTADAIAQARVAVSKLPTNPAPTLPLTLDLEQPTTLTNKQIADWALAFLAEAQRLTGKTPWIYASSSYLMEHLAGELRLHEYPVWVAAYAVSMKDVPPQVPIWAKRVGWQFSSQGLVPGIPSMTTDLDVYLGSWKSFQKAYLSAPPKPAVATAPVRPAPVPTAPAIPEQAPAAVCEPRPSSLLLGAVPIVSASDRRGC